MTKTCNKCHKVLELFYFSKQTSAKDGLNPRCRCCIREDREPKMAMYRESQSLYRKRIGSTFLKKRSVEKHPEKEKARRYLQESVRVGRVVKPDTCERCLKPFPKPQIQGHHKDYNKRLEVMWLCVKCHHQVHFEEAAALVAAAEGGA